MGITRLVEIHQSGRLDMGELERKAICRRQALSVFGFATAFGLLATSAMMSRAEAQAGTAPAAPAPADTTKSGTERRQDRRSGRTDRRQDRRTGRDERRDERRTGRDQRRDGSEQKK